MMSPVEQRENYSELPIFLVKMGRLGILGQSIVNLYTKPKEKARPVGFRVIEIQPTPNPNAAKFVLDRPVSQQPISFFNAEAAKDYPLAVKLFAIPGVSSLLLLGDFITINKSPDADWDDISDQARAVLSAAEPA